MEDKILKIVENTIKTIKEGENPYKDLQFVNEALKGKSDKIIEDVKNILKETFVGQLSENLFIGESLTTEQHLYNYLYENNCLSGYKMIAEYMLFPSNPKGK